MPPLAASRRTLARAIVAASATLSLALLATACGGDSTGPSVTSPPDGATKTLLVDASQQFAYVDLASTAQLVTVDQPASSTAWDMGFFSTTVALNGGASGPADVTAYCVCGNASASDEAVAAMTPQSELADFDRVTAANIPPDGTFQADQPAPAIEGWFTGVPPAVAAAPTNSWIVRYTASPALLAKFRVTAIANATATSPGQVSIEYAAQTAPGGAFGPVVARTVSVGSTPAYVALDATGAGTADAHDLRIEGYTIRLGADAAAVLVESTPFADVTADFAASVPAMVFRTDATASVFNEQPWYRYNITNSNPPQIWPTYNVYLVKRGAEVFKVQLIGYYDEAGQSRRITMRYAQLR